MGRQSARIYFNGQDHKDMVTWDGSKFVYHDKAYIWNSQTHSFQLVWEKLHGLKLLYETTLEIQPVSSENNKYLYFVEDNIGNIIYRIKINDKNPEAEEFFTSNTYNVFSAPVSSRGFAIHRQARQYTNRDIYYRMLDLEEGTVITSDIFHVSSWNFMPEPNLKNQELSPAESGMDHGYASVFSTCAVGQTYQPRNFLFFIAPTGISSMLLNMWDSAGTWIAYANGIWDLGRLADGTAAGLLPRFLRLNNNFEFEILEYGAQVGSNAYTITHRDTPPFTIAPVVLERMVIRDGKLPMMDSEGNIWIVSIDGNSISYENTEVTSSLLDSYTSINVSPDYKYAMVTRQNEEGQNYLRDIVDIKTKKVIMNINEEAGMPIIHDCYFVGHKCFYVWGNTQGSTSSTYNRRRLYKWR